MTHTTSRARETESSGRIGRRRFLKTASLGVAASAGAAAMAAVSSGKAEAAGPEQAQGGYRETDHIRRIYALARF
ncbi:MAG: formate dehydrogenase [Alphaproteobacteria bacterium]|jgi:hypothetical protein|nr:formate dehydrogenase [Alphaproteobacteria bacterium]